MTDEMPEDVDQELAELYAAERQRPAPSAEARAAVQAMLAASLSLPLVTGSAASAAAGGAASSGAGVATTSTVATGASWLTPLLKPAVLLAFAAGTATGVGSHAIYDHAVEPTPAVIRPAVIITTGEIMLMTLAGRMVGMRMRITMMIFGMIHIW